MNTKLNLCVILLVFVSLNSCKETESTRPVYTADKWENPEWENPGIFQINRESPTASFYRYPDAQAALANDSSAFGALNKQMLAFVEGMERQQVSPLGKICRWSTVEGRSSAQETYQQYNKHIENINTHYLMYIKMC